jgi:hypothetical protein
MMVVLLPAPKRVRGERIVSGNGERRRNLRHLIKLFRPFFQSENPNLPLPTCSLFPVPRLQFSAPNAHYAAAADRAVPSSPHPYD